MSAVISQIIPAPVAPDLTDRWARASERARLANVIVTAYDHFGNFKVTSASHPGVEYLTDGLNCTCQAAEHGDPVCLHRAAVNDHKALRGPACPICSDTGIEYVSIWCWTTGEAVTLCGMPCRCQTTPEPVPPAPMVALVAIADLESELSDAMADLDRNHDRLGALNEKMDRQGGRLSDRDFDSLSREGDRNREIYDRIRSLKAQIVETAPVAA